MVITSMADEYLKSAEIIKKRINDLSEMKKSKNYHDQKTLEDRIILLTAEYYYLIRIAAYLNHYYQPVPCYKF